MSLNINQSHISEVRDQMSLDYASGEYLNVISNNLGINRPPFGFSDAVWRALVKILAIEYKQVATKFYAALSVLFGPKVTQVGTLLEDALIGTRVIYLNDTSKFPQTGTVVLDQGLASEETLEYVLVDRKNDAMFLQTPVTKDHSSRTFDAESSILLVDSLHTAIVVTNSTRFPTTDYPYPVVLGRGTSAEEVVLVTNNDIDSGILTTLTAPQNAHDSLESTAVYSSLAQDYRTSSPYLVLDDTKQWPDSGVVLLDAVDSFTVDSSSSLEALDVAANTFTEHRQIGNIVVFDGNITSALADVEAEIFENTDSRLTFWEQLPAIPASGDTFKIRPRLEYTRNNYDDSVLVLRRDIDDLSIPSSTKVELLDNVETAALAPVKVPGAGWDVIQSTPKVVELFLPDDLEEELTSRSASYVHTTEISPTPSTTTTAAYSLLDTTLTVSSTADFPTVGVVVLDKGGANEERVAALVLNSTTFLLPHGTNNAHSNGTTVELYQPAYSSTDLLVGDYRQTEDTFPGPYTYNTEAPAPTGTAELTIIDNTVVPGPTRLAVTQIFGKEVLEVEDAVSFLLLPFPSVLQLGRSTGNVEELNILDLNLKWRVTPTVAAAVSVGDTEIEVSALSGGGSSSAADLPDADGYRVLVGNEVCYVVGTATSPDRILLEDPVTESHSTGEDVRLLADLITVDPLSFIHTGYISRDQRSTALSSEARWEPSAPDQQEAAESVEVEVESIPLVSTTGLDSSGGRVILNFGSEKTYQKTTLDAAASAGDTTISCVDTSGFTEGAILYIARGSRKQEIVIGTNDTSTDSFSMLHSFGLLYDHDTGTSVEAFPGDSEVLNYTSISGGEIRFSPSIVVNSAHVYTEPVVASNVDSVPQERGYGYPLRFPVDIKFQLDFIFDLIRTAGVQAKFISKR